MVYKKRTEAPADIAVLIAAFNQLVDFRQNHEARVEHLFKEFSEKMLQSELSAENLKDLQSEYMRLIENEIHPDIRAAFRFPGVVNAVMEIRRLIVEGTALVDIINAWNGYRTQDFQISRGGDFPYHFNEKGFLVSSSRILEIFSRMTPERIRICRAPGCGKIFWAKKSNAETCSPEHASAYGNLKRSKKYREQEEARRRWMEAPPEIM